MRCARQGRPVELSVLILSSDLWCNLARNMDASEAVPRGKLSRIAALLPETKESALLLLRIDSHAPSAGLDSRRRSRGPGTFVPDCTIHPHTMDYQLLSTAPIYDVQQKGHSLRTVNDESQTFVCTEEGSV